MPSRFEELERGSPQLIFRLKKAMNHEGSELAKEALSAILQLCAELDAMETEVVILDEDVEELAKEVYLKATAAQIGCGGELESWKSATLARFAKSSRAVARAFYYPEEENAGT